MNARLETLNAETGFSVAVPPLDVAGARRRLFPSDQTARGEMPPAQLNGAAGIGPARVLIGALLAGRANTCRPDGLGLLRRGGPSTPTSKGR
jgi:hypothetical protein